MKRSSRFIAVLCSFVLFVLTASSQVKASTVTATLSDKFIYLYVNQTSKVNIVNTKKKATYLYESSDKKIASINNKGVVKGRSFGSTVITVKEKYKKQIIEIGFIQVKVRPNIDRAKEIERSLVSTGNNYRMKKAIEKAKNGDPVTIAYIGGSITEGIGATSNTSCYAYRSYEYFKKTFGKGDGSNVKFLDAGIGNTPSTLGMIRYENDVLKRAESAPDIVFVEFAVNDNADQTNGDAYESLVRNILKGDSKPAVVLLFSIFKSKWNLQSRLQPVGEHYKLPMVSVYDAILPDLRSFAMLDADFFADEYHPNDAGHQLYAECIGHYFDVVNKEEIATSDLTIPDSAKIGKSYEGIKMIDSKSTSEYYKVESGSFNGTDSGTGIMKYGLKIFQNNWMHSATAGNNSMKLTVTCKNFLVVYKSANSNTGKLDIYVDGVKKQTIDGTAGGGWNNPCTNVIFNDTSSVKHNIEIKMADDSITKNFTIMAIGYTK